MLRYEMKRNVIFVDLQNGYTAIGVSKLNKESNCFNVSIMLKENTITLWELCEKAENLIFIDSDSKSINRDMAEFIEQKLNEGFFDYYINRYEYEQKCFDKGHEFFEQERLNAS